jgi:hypothetical protein
VEVTSFLAEAQKPLPQFRVEAPHWPLKKQPFDVKPETPDVNVQPAQSERASHAALQEHESPTFGAGLPPEIVAP